MKPLLIIAPLAPTCAASAAASSAPNSATSAWRQLLTRTPARNSTPLATVAAKSVEPSAVIVASGSSTGASGKAPRSIACMPIAPASGQATQNVRMNGAARNGNGSQRAIATVTAPTITANSGTQRYI